MLSVRLVQFGVTMMDRVARGSQSKREIVINHSLVVALNQRRCPLRYQPQMKFVGNNDEENLFPHPAALSPASESCLVEISFCEVNWKNIYGCEGILNKKAKTDPWEGNKARGIGIEF